jgi:aminopeptidase-like protein
VTIAADRRAGAPAGPEDPGERMTAMMRRLFPLCRSITGDGVRATLDIVGERLPLERHAVPSGTQVFDWTVNDEWNVRDAYVADRHGNRVVDFREHNLHLVSYSAPVRERLTLDQLRPHLHTLRDRPDWIPYRTSYYRRDWGFCLPHRQLEAMDDGPYDVVVDSTLAPGELTYGELLIPGETDDEVILTAHVCHPSLANDNLSGIAVATELAGAVAAMPARRYTYRFLFAPGTIGSLTWLSRNAEVLPRIRHGYDERQFNAIGFDLAVGRLSRTPHGEYPEYHTSADDLDFVQAAELVDSYRSILRIVDVLENDGVYRNCSPYGEPQLGRRGLYPSVGGRTADDAVMAMLWTLAYADGSAGLLDIATVAGLDFADVRAASAALADAGLLEPVAEEGSSGA